MMSKLFKVQLQGSGRWEKAGTLALLLLVAGAGAAPAVDTPGFISPVNISNTAERYSIGSLTVDYDGVTHIAWYDWESPRLYYSTNASGSWSKERITSDVKHGTPRLIVTRQDSRLYVFEVKHHYYVKPTQGGEWSPRQEVGDTYEGGYLEDVAVDGDDNMVVCWIKLFSDSTPKRNSLCIARKPYMQDWQDVEVVHANNDDGGFPAEGRVGIINGNIWISWHEGDNAYYRIRYENSQWSDIRRLNTLTGVNGVHNCDFVPNPHNNNQVAMTWDADFEKRCDLDWRGYVQFSEDAGATWTSRRAVTENCWIGGAPSSCWDPWGNYHMLLKRQDDNYDHSDTYYMGRLDGSWTGNIRLSNDSQRTGVNNGCIVYRNYHVHAVFNETVNGFEDVYYTIGQMNYPTYTPGSPTPTRTNSPNWTSTPTQTHTPTQTPTVTHTGTVTNTPRWGSSTATPTPMDQGTNTPTPTKTPETVEAPLSVTLW